MPTALPLEALETDREFAARHIGPDAADEARMLGVIGAASREALMQTIVPAAIRRPAPMDLPAPAGEAQALAELKAIAAKNRVLKSFIGQGYYAAHTPGVIQRNILENPAWYTAYTPYQAEISQGRLEALLNFQTLAVLRTRAEPWAGNWTAPPTTPPSTPPCRPRTLAHWSNTPAAPVPSATGAMRPHTATSSRHCSSSPPTCWP